MMPLSMSGAGAAQIIKKIGGKEEVRSFLEKLGFVVGGEVTVISEIAGNMVVNVKGARVAIGKDMANKIKMCIRDSSSGSLLLQDQAYPRCLRLCSPHHLRSDVPSERIYPVSYTHLDVYKRQK